MSIKSNAAHQSHPFNPIYDSNSDLLILGSFPSIKSRENDFYYGHPQNRFWKVISSLYNTKLPSTIEAKTSLLLTNHIAIWDVIESCDIVGSSDSSIRNVTPSNIKSLLDSTNIKHIYANGATAKKLYDKYILASTLVPIVCLPSTSPANAVYTLPRLISSWNVIIKDS